MKDFNVTVKVRNNQLVERREQLGLTAPKFAKAVGISYGRYLNYENVKTNPFNRLTGELNEGALKISVYLGLSADELWPKEVQEFEGRTRVFRLNKDEIEALMGEYSRQSSLPPDELYEDLELHQNVRRAAMLLTPLERGVLAERFDLGIDGMMLSPPDPRSYQIGEKAIGRLASRGILELTNLLER